jgi:hypothetical protein
MVLLAVSLLASVVLLVNWLWRRSRRRRRAPDVNPETAESAAPDRAEAPAEGALALLALVGPPSYLLALAVPIVMGLWWGPDCVRYVLSAVVLPLLLLGAIALRGLARMPARGGVAAAAAALSIGALAWLPVLSATGSAGGVVATIPSSGSVAAGGTNPFYGPEVAFIDDVIRRHHLHNGYAGYWMAKPVTLFSRTGTTVVVLFDQGDPPMPSFWISNPNWWVQGRNRPKTKGLVTAADYPVFDYALCPSLNRQWVEAQFGPPAAVESGPGGDVLIYNRPSDVLFRNAGRVQAAREAGVPQESRVVRPGVLSRPKPPGAQWNALGTAKIPPGGSLTLRLAKPIPADFLRIQADNNDTYELEFRLGGQTVGTATAGPVPGMGLAGRDVNLVPATGGRPFDTIVIRGSGGDGVYSVGHVAVFTDPVLHPPMLRPSTSP